MDNSNVTKLHPKDKNQKEEVSLVSSLSPREIVSELKSTTHSAIIGDIADQVKQEFFGEEVEVSPRSRKSDKDIPNDEGKVEKSIRKARKNQRKKRTI